MNTDDIRYIVAYDNPDSSEQRQSKYITDKAIYWYKWQADRAAKTIGGWVITVNLEPEPSSLFNEPDLTL